MPSEPYHEGHVGSGEQATPVSHAEGSGEPAQMREGSPGGLTEWQQQREGHKLGLWSHFYKIRLSLESVTDSYRPAGAGKPEVAGIFRHLGWWV